MFTCAAAPRVFQACPYTYAMKQCIVEALIRLQLQVQMFGQKDFRRYTIKQNPVFEFLIAKFCNLEQARRNLDYLLQEIIHLSQLSHQAALCDQDPFTYELLNAQSRIRAELETWLRALSLSTDDLHLDTNLTASLAYKFLILYYKMARIMAQTCLDTGKDPSTKVSLAISSLCFPRPWI
jgi:hypothetical protein